jgi:hypothetical protein
MILYYDTISNEQFVDIKELQAITGKNKTYLHRLIKNQKLFQIKYKNQFLLRLSDFNSGFEGLKVS